MYDFRSWRELSACISCGLSGVQNPGTLVLCVVGGGLIHGSGGYIQWGDQKLYVYCESGAFWGRPSGWLRFRRPSCIHVWDVGMLPVPSSQWACSLCCDDGLIYFLAGSEMAETVFTPSLEGMKHVKAENGVILTKPFLDVCKQILPVLGNSFASLSAAQMFWNLSSSGCIS